MQIRDMDAYDLVTELRRCREVAARHDQNAADPTCTEVNRRGWKMSAARLTERAGQLTEEARDRADPEIGRWLEFYRMTL